MSVNFPLESSFIFDGSTPIDNVRQSSIDLKIDHSIQVVEDVLENAFLTLETNLEENMLNEISSLIKLCFSYYPDQLTQFFNQLLEKSHTKINYMYALAFLFLNSPKIQVEFDSKTFFNECLQQILPQLQKDSTNITLFDQEIPPQISSTFLINLFLLTDITKEMLPIISGYIFSRENIDSEKIESFIQKVIDLDMVSFLSPNIYSNSKIPNVIPTKYLYKTCTYLPENFFREKFNEIQKVCLNLESKDPKYFIPFINKSLGYNIKLDSSINSNIIDLIDDQILTPLNFQWYKDFDLLETTNLILFSCRCSYRPFSKMNVEKNPRFWANLIKCIMNSGKSTLSGKLDSWDSSLYSVSARLGVNEFFDSIILSCFPLNRDITSRLVNTLRDFQRRKKKKFYSIEHQTDLLTKVIKFEKVPYPQFWELISNEVICSVAKDKIINGEEIEPLLLYAVDYVRMKIDTKCDVVFEKLKILPQDDESIQEVIEFVQYDNLLNLFDIPIQSLSLIISASIFRNSKQKILIDEPNKIVILLLYLLTKNKSFGCPENYEFLSQNFSEILSNNEFLNLYKNSPFFVSLIELLPDSDDVNLIYLELCESIINNKNNQDSRIILRKIYAISNKSNTAEIDNFFNKNGLRLIEFSIENLYKINLHFPDKFNFNCIKQPEIKQQIVNMIESKSNIDVSQMKYFISQLCLNSPKIDFEKIENIERSTDDIVSIILKFNYFQSGNERSYFYSNIFNIFMKERSNALKYFNILFEKLEKTNKKVTPKTILENYKNYYIKYENYFIESFNFNYVYNKETDQIIQRCSLEQIQNSEKSLSIISKLFESIKRDCYNYSIMSVLRNIASSFPFLFESNTTELFELVLSKINPDLEDKTYDQMSTISLYFLQSCLYSTKILNDFINWLCDKLTALNKSQTIQFLMLFNSLFVNPSDSMKKVLIAYITKFSFVDKFRVLLNEDNDLYGRINHYRNIIIQLLRNFYSILIDVKDLDSVVIDELQKDDNPAKCEMNYTILPTTLNPKNVEFYKQDDDSFSKSYDFYIFNQINTTNVNSDEIEEFISKIKLEKQQKFIKMTRFFVHQPHFVKSMLNVSNPAFSENFSTISKAIKDFEEIYNEDDDQENCELEEIKKKLFSANLSKNLLILIFKIKTICEKNKIYTDMINTFLNTFKKSKELLSFALETINELCHDDPLIDLADLIDLVLFFSDSEFLIELFEKICNESFIDAALLPKYRNNENVIQKIIILYATNNIKFPNRLIHFVNFVFLSGKKNLIFKVFKIVKKVDDENLCYISDSIKFSFLSLLEEEEEEEEEYISTNLISEFIDVVPSFLKENSYEILNFLKNHSNNIKNIEFIVKMLKLLAPERNDTFSNTLSEVISNDKSRNENSNRIIPEKIFNSMPLYWQTFEIYFSKIGSENFIDFIPIYPELFSFNERLSYFKKSLKNLRNYSNIRFTINRRNLIESSINLFKNLSHDDMLKSPKVKFHGEPGSDYGGLTKDWLTNLTSELFDPDYGYFDQTENKNSFQPNKNCFELEYFKFAGQIVAFSIINEVYINVHLVKSFIKQILHHEVQFTDLEFSDGKLFNSLSWILENKIDDELEMDFTIIDSKNDETEDHEVIELVPNGKDKLVTDSNKKEYVNLIYKHYLHDVFKDQIKAFCDGFDYLIPHEMIRIFTSSELDLIICGTPIIDVEDFRRNIRFKGGYNNDSPTIKYFFNAISKWNQNDLAKLLLFITGSSQVPATGFVEFANSGNPLTICYYDCSTDRLPVSHTCFNKIDLPPYESEELLNRKLLFVVNECNDFGLA